MNLREIGGLSPDAAVMAEDSGSREVVAFDLAHQVVIDVSLPRHVIRLSLDLSRSTSEFFCR